jgi:hypothetical protein
MHGLLVSSFFFLLPADETLEILLGHGP